MSSENTALAVAPAAGNPSPMQRQLQSVERDSRNPASLVALLRSIVTVVERPPLLAVDAGGHATEVAEHAAPAPAEPSPETLDTPAFLRRVPRFVAADQVDEKPHEPGPREWALKCHVIAFQAIREGRKTFEVRSTERDIRTGDTIALHPVGDSGEPAGPPLYVYAGFVLRGGDFGTPMGDYIVFSITPRDTAGPAPDARAEEAEARAGGLREVLDKTRAELGQARAALAAFGRSAEEWNATEKRLLAERDTARRNCNAFGRRNLALMSVLDDLRAAHADQLKRRRIAEHERDGALASAKKQRREKDRLIRQRTRSRELAAASTDRGLLDELRAFVALRTPVEERL